MMIRKRALLLGVMTLACGAAFPSFAGKTTQISLPDARVKMLPFNQDDIFRLVGHFGYTTTIEFGPYEQIETVSLGDSEAWQVTKPGRPNILFVKPLEENAATNMTVLTTDHIYTFDMTAAKADPDSSDLTFRLKFSYPGDTSKDDDYSLGIAEPTNNWNFDYSYSGEQSLRPKRVFDDGRFTYFQLEDYGAVPAIFAVNRKGEESLANFNVEKGYIVVSRVARQFTLRDGDQSICIFNDSYSRKTGYESAKMPPPPVIEAFPEESAAPLPGHKPNRTLASLSGLFDFVDDFEQPLSENLNN